MLKVCGLSGYALAIAFYTRVRVAKLQAHVWGVLGPALYGKECS